MLLEVPPKIIIIQETLVKTECFWKCPKLQQFRKPWWRRNASGNMPKTTTIQETLVKTECYWQYLKKNNNSGNPGEDGVLLEVLLLRWRPHPHLWVHRRPEEPLGEGAPQRQQRADWRAHWETGQGKPYYTVKKAAGKYLPLFRCRRFMYLDDDLYFVLL